MRDTRMNGGLSMPREFDMNPVARDARIELFTAPAALVGPWLVHVEANRVQRDGIESKLAPKVMLVLRCLMARPYQVVSRETLLDTVWPEADVGEEVLTQTIAELRRALGESARDGHCIETIRKVGYQLRATVMPLQQAPPPSPEPAPDAAAALPVPALAMLAQVPTDATVAAPESGTPPDQVRAEMRPFSHLARWMLGAMIGALAIASAYRWQPPNQSPVGDGTTVASGASPHPRPLTTDLGNESMPAVSPDGSGVAYLEVTLDGSGLHEELLLRGVGSARSQLIARSNPESGYLQAPAWSGDGRQLAFVRVNGPQCRIVALAAIGGAGDERTLGECQTLDWPFMTIDWSPDNRWIAFSRPLVPDDPQSPLRIHRLDTSTGAVQAVPYALTDGNSRRPKFSPDGKLLAFVHGVPGAFHVYVVPAAGGSVRQLTHDDTALEGYTWAPDSQTIVYSASQRLLRVALADLSVSDLGIGDAVQPSYARHREVLVYATSWVSALNLQRYVRDSASASSEPMARPRDTLFASTRHSYMPRWAPDAQRIAFASDRSGAEQLWVGDAQGGQARQLSALKEGERIEELSWLPDGRALAMAYVDSAGSGHVLLFSLRGDPVRELWRHDSRVLSLAASADGRHILVAPAAPDARLRRIDIESGEPEILPLQDIQRIADPGDGYLYFDRLADTAVFRIALDSQTVERLRGSERVNPQTAWAVTRQGVVVWASVVGGEALMLVPRDTASAPRLYTGIAGTFGMGDFALSPDEREIIFPVNGSRESDLMVLER